jgi:hypothetical protein
VPSRSLAAPVVAVGILAALTGGLGRSGTYLPFLIEARGPLLSFVVWE